MGGCIGKESGAQRGSCMPRLRRSKSFVFKRNDIKVISSVTGASSPHENKQPYHGVTFYASRSDMPDVCQYVRGDANGYAIKHESQSKHIPELHLDPSDVRDDAAWAWAFTGRKSKNVRIHIAGLTR